MKYLSILLVVISYLLINTSCTKNNKEDIVAGLTPCDTTNTTYNAVIKPILDQYCNSNGCHNATSIAAGYNLEDYNALKPVALGSRFLQTLRHEPGFSRMPKGADKLTDCQIKKIEIWVNNGAQNN